MTALKKEIAGLLAVFLLFSLCGPTALAKSQSQPTVRLLCDSAPRGGVAEVQLVLENGPDVFGGDILIAYDDTMTVLNTGVGDSGASTQINPDYAPGQIKVVLAGTQPFPADCVLATFTFRISSEAAGDPEITLPEAILYGSDFAELPCTRENASIRLMGVALSVGSCQGEVGQRVEIPVYLNGDPCVAGGSFKLSYDPAALTDLQILPGILDRDFQQNTNTPGELAIGWVHTEHLRESGALLTLSFLVGEGAQRSNPLRLSEVTLADTAGIPQKVTTRDGLVTVSPESLRPELWAETVEADFGEDVQMTIRINSAGLAAGYLFTLRYPEGCELVTAQASSDVLVNDSTPGEIQATSAGIVPDNGDKDVLQLTFRVVQDGTDYPITFSQVTMSDEAGQPIADVAVTPGSITTLARKVTLTGTDCSDSVTLRVEDLHPGYCIVSVYDKNGRQLTSGIQPMEDCQGISRELTVSYRGFDLREGDTLRVFVLGTKFDPQRDCLIRTLTGGLLSR